MYPLPPFTPTLILARRAATQARKRAHRETQRQLTQNNPA